MISDECPFLLARPNHKVSASSLPDKNMDFFPFQAQAHRRQPVLTLTYRFLWNIHYSCYHSL